MLNVSNLTLYVISSHVENANLQKTLDSFTFKNEFLGKTVKLNSEWKRFVDIQTIMASRKDVEYNPIGWYGIVYDNEAITPGLANALMTYLSMDFDVLVAMKKNGDEMSQAPRFFKNHVVLPNESLLPDKGIDLKYTRMMDGWIIEHD